MNLIIRTMLIMSSSLVMLSAETAEELNQQGLDLYRAEKYGAAVAKFEKALQVNPRYGWGHYNLACTLGVLRKKGGVCDYNAYKGRIVSHLTLAAKYQPLVKRKIQKDPDLDGVRDTIGYQKLLGLSMKRPADLKIIMVRVTTWYGPAPGAYGHTSAFSFKRDGTVSFWYLKMKEDGMPVRTTLKGRWSLSGKQILIRFNKPYGGRRVYKGTFSRDGALSFKGMFGSYHDTPEECSA